jgi:putative heme-binding domain-containing protein
MFSGVGFMKIASPVGQLLLASLLVSAPAVPAQTTGLRVPEGFEVVEWADNSQVPDSYCMTVDPRGRVVVSGRGYIRMLLDGKNDNRATRVLEFTGPPADGAMGLWWDKEDLYCMGDGGLRRYRDADAGGRTRPSELLYSFKTGGEHAAHAIRRGPDGWLYVLLGNNTDVRRKDASLPTSPVKNPIAGCVMRFPPDFKGAEIVADGFRNAYGMDFNTDGELFTFDSDNERCVSLPWYEFTRFYHVAPGGHYAWEAPQYASAWRYPPYCLDVVPPVDAMERGSPTGVVCYRHTQFPERYRGGFFLLDWTFGRIWFVKLEKAGSSYRATKEIFLQASGENGFAPTAAAVDPDTGDLYVSIGGRGTRGGVYRIRYPAGMKSIRAEDVARLQPSPRSLDWQPGQQAALLRQAQDDDLAVRWRAMLTIERHRVQFSPAQIVEAIQANVNQTDRLLRQTTARLLASLPDTEREQFQKQVHTPQARITVGLSRGGASLLDLIVDRKLSHELRLDAVRLLQMHIGEVMADKSKGTVWEGYTRRKELKIDDKVGAVVRDAFPTGSPDLDRELSRTLALIEDDAAATPGKIVSCLTETSDPLEDFHFLIVLGRLGGPTSPEITRGIARALLRLEGKVAGRGRTRDSHWPLRLAEVYSALVRRHPGLNDVLLADPLFGRADHVVFTDAPGFDRPRAAARFLAQADRDRDFGWNAHLIRLVGTLPDEKALPVLRRLWGQAGQDEAILPLLARRHHPEDRERLREGLGSGQLATVKAAVEGLANLPAQARDQPDRNEILALVLALRRLPSGKDGDPVRTPLVRLLQTSAKQNFPDAEAWSKWLAGTWPELAPRVRNTDGVDVEAWNKRLAGIDANTGDGDRGRQIFIKASCASCHSGSQALGPDLQGVAGRFSRADLFTAILQPSKDVATRYRTTLLTTSAGKTYQGLIVYEATDSLILQTGPATTIRLTNAQITDRRITTQSLMPAGLLDRLTDLEIADLYGYLKTLGKPMQGVSRDKDR